MVDAIKPAPAFSVSGDVGRAPVVFFDEAPTFAGFGGIAAVTLSAVLHTLVGDGTVTMENHVVAHLRSNAEGFRRLRAAIDGALLALEPTGGPVS